MNIYESAAFRLLQQGMKDKWAFAICWALIHYHELQAWREFDRWAQEMLNDEQERSE